MLIVIEKIVKLFAYIFTMFYFATATACPQATPTNDPGFCSSFKIAAQCHCTASHLPSRMCMDMNLLYDRMLIIFQTVKKACEYQTDTSTQNCIDSWNCYRNGGYNSKNELCSGTGASCA
jgi:hypothetical protein